MAIQKTKDGYLIQINYKDPTTGTYKKLSARRKNIKKRDAIEIESELRKKAEQLAHGILDNKNITVSAAAIDFLNYEQTQRRVTSLRQKTQRIKVFIIDYFNQSPISVLTSASVWLNWRNYINNYISPRTNTKLLCITKNNILKDVSTFMTFLNKFKDFDTRAFKKLERFKDPNEIESNKIHFWTLEEFKKVDEVLEKECKTFKQYIVRVLINTLFFTGMRKSESYALTWNDYIYLNGNYFFDINKGLIQKAKDKNGFYFVGPTKNKSSKRKIMLINRISNMINDLKNKTTKSGINTKSSDFIFGGFSPISDTLLADTLSKAAKTAGVSHIKVHDLRHSFVTLLINMDVNIKTISALVGHSTTKITWDTYGHLYPEKENNAIIDLNKVAK